MIVTQTASEAYIEIVKHVLDYPQYRCAPRGLPILECTDMMFKVLDPTTEPIHTLDPERNEVIKRYTQQEVELYNSGTNLVKDFAEASKFWNKIVNPDGLTINSAYGHLIWKKRSCGNPRFEVARMLGDDMEAASQPLVAEQMGVHEMMLTPWEWCVRSLKEDRDTRQAVLRFSLPEHHWRNNRDFVCTMHGNFLIRGDYLNLMIVMRSNDLAKGLVYDLTWFISLIYKMVDDLKLVYPELKVGTYTQLSHSMHIYERDIPQMMKVVGR